MTQGIKIEPNEPDGLPGRRLLIRDTTDWLKRNALAITDVLIEQHVERNTGDRQVKVTATLYNGTRLEYWNGRNKPRTIARQVRQYIGYNSAPIRILNHQTKRS